MIAEKVSGWFAVTLLLFSHLSAAQEPAYGGAPKAQARAIRIHYTAQKEPTLTDYQALLADPDITGDPDLLKAIYARWVALTCKGKQAKLAAIGITDKVMSQELYNTCSARLLALPPSTALAANPSTITAPVQPVGAPAQADKARSSVTTNPRQSAPTTPTPLTADQLNALDAAVGALVVPVGCSLLPSPAKKVDPSQQVVSNLNPILMASESIPTDWLHLSANSSGAEHKYRPFVWVGYVNRLRYAATLGGVVTVIQAPSIPNNIYPGPAVTPPTKQPGGGGPLLPGSKPSQKVFADLNKCINDIQTEAVTFQQNLATFEILLNAARSRIATRLSALAPVVNSVAEARSAADLSIFPTTNAPPFPLPEVSALRGLLTEVSTVYSQTAQWAATDPTNLLKNEYDAENASASATGKALDQYLATGRPAGGTQPPDPSSTKTGGVVLSGSNGGTHASPAPKDAGSGNTGSSSSSNPTNPADSNPTPNKSSSDTCSAKIDAGSQEVNDYEDNRCYVDSWRDRFRTVAGANDLYFVAVFKPVCGGWFGQGTSTQMQLTLVDSTSPSTSPNPITLDKIVCQPPLTISSGLGLSFVPSHVPAFVAGIQKDASGKPILDPTGNPTIIQTLGYSSSAAVNPSYSLLVNVALFPIKHSEMEIHWTGGAMLTASTSGTTTDVLSGPAISFRKRAFFVSPVYDLGLRTDYQSGFAVGMPQGKLTSPPTAQTWKSGFGLTLTFPFTQSSSNQNSNSGAAGTPSTNGGSGDKTAPPNPGNNKKQPTKDGTTSPVSNP